METINNKGLIDVSEFELPREAKTEIIILEEAHALVESTYSDQAFSPRKYGRRTNAAPIEEAVVAATCFLMPTALQDPLLSAMFIPVQDVRVN
jgi:hypothetical protein